MATTKVDSALIYKDGTLHREHTEEFRFFDVVLFFSNGKPVTIGELNGEESFGNILERVCDKWYDIYDC